MFTTFIKVFITYHIYHFVQVFVTIIKPCYSRGFCINAELFETFCDIICIVIPNNIFKSKKGGILLVQLTVIIREGSLLSFEIFLTEEKVLFLDKVIVSANQIRFHLAETELERTKSILESCEFVLKVSRPK